MSEVRHSHSLDPNELQKKAPEAIQEDKIKNSQCTIEETHTVSGINKENIDNPNTRDCKGLYPLSKL